MSISTESWESTIALVSQIYDKSLPLVYSEEHIDLTCQLLGLFLRKKSFIVVRSTVVLTEPIICFNDVVYISLPLVALLVNKKVDLPPNKVEFVDKVDLFDGLIPAVQKELPYCINKPGYTEDNFNEQFNIEDTVRFSQILRIVLMCGHFYQHYTKKIPYTTHDNFKSLEMAYIPKEVPMANEPPKIDYNLFLNQ